MFETSYRPISDEHPEWGLIALLPWDQRIFGFPVADYQLRDSLYTAKSREAFRACLENWAGTNRVELIGCNAPAEDTIGCALLPVVGFAYVDYTLKINQSRLQSWDPPASKLPVRIAQEEDRTSLEAVAQNAFRAGRYHMDPRFPRALSELRYKHWVANALAAAGPGSRLYVTGEIGKVSGFFHVNIEGDEAYITIIAVQFDKQGGRTGHDLAAGSLADLKSRGIRRMSSKVSAMNSSVINLATYLGWRVSDPQVIFHWHAPNAPHLVQPREIFS